jgi:hypothetical protein
LTLSGGVIAHRLWCRSIHSTIQGGQRHSVLISLASTLVDTTSEAFGVTADADAIANLFNAHLFQDGLIHFQQVLTCDVVLAEDVHVLAAVDAR